MFWQVFEHKHQFDIEVGLVPSKQCVKILTLLKEIVFSNHTLICAEMGKDQKVQMCQHFSIWLRWNQGIGETNQTNASFKFQIRKIKKDC